MKEILFGDTNTNIIQKLRVSWFARLIFAGCCWYCYDIFGRRADIHIDTMIMIFVMGLFIVNMIYIPFRILGSLNLSRKIKLLFVIVADIVILYYWNQAREFSIANIWKDYVAGTIITLSITGIIIALYRLLEVHLQNGKDVGRREQAIDKMDGYTFEVYCAQLLEKKGFHNVSVTQSSGDYGIDIIAYDDKNVKYGIQCKRYSGNVGWHAIEEAKAGAEYYDCNVAVVMTNSFFTKQAIEGAEKIGVVIWDRNWIL